MPASTSALRHLIASHRPRRARDGYPDDVRSEVVRYVSLTRQAGRPLTAVARDLGLPAPTLSRWLAADEDRRGFVAVLVDDDHEPDVRPAQRGGDLSLVTPGGYRVVGLDLDALRRLLVVLP